MPRPSYSNRVWFTRVMMACHAQLRSTVCVVQWLHGHSTVDMVRLCVQFMDHDRMWHPTSSFHVCCPMSIMATTPYVVRPYVFSKGYYSMLRLTSYNCVCILRAMMSNHTKYSSSVCDIEELLLHFTPDVVRP